MRAARERSWCCVLTERVVVHNLLLGDALGLVLVDTLSFVHIDTLCVVLVIALGFVLVDALGFVFVISFVLSLSRYLLLTMQRHKFSV